MDTIMHEKLRDAVTFWDGIPLPDGVLLIGGLDAQPDTDHTVVVRIRNNKKSVWTLEWKARMALPLRDGAAFALLVGVDGETCSVSDNGLTELSPVPIDAREDKFGSLLGGRVVDDQAIVVGYCNQFLVRRPGMNWTAEDAGLPGRSDMPGPMFGFEAVDGFSTGHLYAVGTRGSIWYRTDGTWHPVDSPTNVRLVAVHCADDGWVYACGQRGIVLRGRQNQWSVIAHDPDISYLWGIARIGGQVIVSSNHVMYQVDETGLVPYPFTDRNPEDQHLPFSFFRLFHDGNLVLSVGPKDVLVLTPDTWRRIV